MLNDRVVVVTDQARRIDQICAWEPARNRADLKRKGIDSREALPRQAGAPVDLKEGARLCPRHEQVSYAVATCPYPRDSCRASEGGGGNGSGAAQVRLCGLRLKMARSALAAAVASLLQLCSAAAQEAPVIDADGSADPAEYRREGKGETTQLETIQVTGTRIKGGTVPSPVITIGSERIQEEGFTDLGEVIRSLPQNFSGGQNPGVLGLNQSGSGAANNNLTGGSGLNLRGLGPDATLTLLNGRRMSYSGFVQAVDLSAVPLDAVDRVEVVADGASAIYGSDAVGGVGNVILKRDYDGVAVGARYGGATDGGLTTTEYTATAGTVWASGGVIATYKDVAADPIYARQRTYTADVLPDPSTIYPDSDLRSLLVSGYQWLGPSVELRLDVLRTRRDQRYYYYPNPTLYSGVTTETTTTFAAPSIELSLPNDWMLSVGGALGKDEHVQDQSMVPVATGTPMPLLYECFCNKSQTWDVSAEGPLFTTAGGEARLAVGAGYRKNAFRRANYLTGTNAVEGDESSRFAYAEISIPLIGPDMGMAGVHRLALTGAARTEDYSSFGRVTTPKLGLIYGPSKDVTLKASWGRSFKAPTLMQRYLPATAGLVYPSDYGGAGYAPGETLMYLDGGNPDLGPERARTWSASATFHPTAHPGFEAELTWFGIEYRDRVVQPITNWAGAMGTAAYAEFFSYGPTPEALARTLAASDVFFNYVDAPYDPANVVAIMHSQYINAARQQVRGVDLSGSHWRDLGPGRLTLRGSVSWLDSAQQTTVSQGFTDLSGTLFNPSRIHGRAGLVWDQGGLTASAFATYVGSVTDTTDREKTASFTTLDAVLRYSSDARGGAWSGVEVALSVQNLLDRKPPLYTPASPVLVPPYDSTNYSAIGRFASVWLSKHW
jgi:iron complex outermembrane receptor protein